MRESFSPDQLLALKVALGGRTWGAHALDLRFILKWWRWQVYLVLLAGVLRRSTSKAFVVGAQLLGQGGGICKSGTCAAVESIDL
jgi:triacylglycerol esterase/lipase EstA (alpha/beta hydrolase family)